MVLIFCVEFRELSHLTRDLSQAEKKINVVRAEKIYKKKVKSCHFVNLLSFERKVLSFSACDPTAN